MNLGVMLLHCRLALQDMKVAKVLETQLVRSLNEGKNELAKLVRQAREDWFLTTTSGTISAVSAPNYSSITLPTDFAELKEIALTDSGYEGTEFKYLDRSDPRFKDALIGGGPADGYFYDIVGVSTMIFAPGFDTARPYLMAYIATVADMTKRSDSPSLLPAEHHDFLVTWAVTDVLASLGDPRFPAYQQKLNYQKDSIVNAVNETILKEPKFVRGFMEEEGW